MMSESDFDTSDYIVVECQKPPNNNSKTVIIPKSWITLELEENKVAFAYPLEDEATTARRIKNKEDVNKDWKLFMGDMKCETQSYQTAQHFIRTLNNKQHDDAFKENFEHERPKNINAKKIQKKPKVLLKNNLNKKKLGKRKIITKARARQVANNIQETLKANVSSSDIMKNNSSNPIQSEKEKESCIPHNNPENSNNLESKIKEIINKSLPQTLIKPIADTENSDFDKNISSMLLNSNFTTVEKQFLMELQTNQRETMINIKVVLLYLKKLYLKVQENKKTLDEIVSKYQHNDSTNSTVVLEEQGQNNSSKESENNVKDVEMEKETENTQDSDEEDQESDQESIPDNESFQEEDTLWTLKYPNPGKGVVKLVQNENIYVSEKGLKNCKAKCKNITTLARALIKEVFKEKALFSCSLPGFNTKKNNRNPRPPLHIPARNAIITYVYEYRKEVGWEKIGMNQLFSSMQSLLKEIRLKNSKEVLLD